MLDFKSDLFEIYRQNDSDFSKYEKTVEYCTRIKRLVRGNDMAKFYTILNKLEFLINNVVWEGKKDEMLQIIRDEKYKISDKYEDFLP